MKFVSATAAAMLIGASAHAATFDFAGLATGNEKSVEGLSETDGGITVSFDANSTFSAYYDGLSDERPAGLGVCKIIGASGECDPSSDDNVTTGESVVLSFNKIVDVMGLIFRGERHFLVDEPPGEISSSETLLINGSEYSFGTAQTTSFFGVTSMTFAFGGSNPEQFYLSSLDAVPNVVPVPAALSLLLAGLGGLAWIGRRTIRG